MTPNLVDAAGLDRRGVLFSAENLRRGAFDNDPLIHSTGLWRRVVLYSVPPVLTLTGRAPPDAADRASTPPASRRIRTRPSGPARPARAASPRSRRRSRR